MRRFAAAAALCCGCNQIYGLDATRARDAAPDAPDRVLRLSLLLGQTTQTANEAPPVLAAITPDPAVKLGLVAEPLVPVAYVADDTSGVVNYPRAFDDKPWRVEYTPPFDVPHEIQWKPPDNAGHLVAPIVGRLERVAAPPNTGLTLSMKMPNNVLYIFSPLTVIYTSGYWSAAPSNVMTLTPEVDFSTATSLAGPRGTPSDAAKDYVVAVDYDEPNLPSKPCTTAKVSGSAAVPALEPGMKKAVELVRFAETNNIDVAYVDETILAAQSRLDTALGARSADGTGGKLYFGRLAHTTMPWFTTTIAGVPAPPFIPLAECPTNTFNLATNHAGDISFAKATYAYAANDRAVNGVRLRSSIATVGLNVPSSNTYLASTNVALATGVTLGAIDLEAADGVAIGAAPLDLSFALQTDVRFLADYYEVTLYRLANTSLEPIRVYIGIDVTAARPTLRFDPSVMTAGAEYVFAIRTYRGRPNARNGDFRTVQNPQSVATMFTRTFRR